MKKLLLMRHAKSDWKQPGLSDHDRPLNARGRAAAPFMGLHLNQHEIHVDAILASTAQRVIETVELLQAELSGPPEVLRSQSLYLATPEQIRREVQSLRDSWQTVLVLAHNPGLALLVNHLSRSHSDMPTAAIAVFEFDSPTWQGVFSGDSPELIHFWKPRELMLE